MARWDIWVVVREYNPRGGGGGALKGLLCCKNAQRGDKESGWAVSLQFMRPRISWCILLGLGDELTEWKGTHSSM